MRPLIERGHLFIAQPPLFKVKRGKSERYIKDERALEAYLLDLALDGIEVSAAGAARPLAAEAVRRLLDAASQYRRLLQRLALRRLDERVIEAAVATGAPREADLSDAARLRGAVAAGIEARIRALFAEPGQLAWSVEPDPEHGGHRLVAETRRAGVDYRTPLDAEFLRGSDFQHLLELARQIEATGGPPYRLLAAAGEPPREIASAVDLLEQLLGLGGKGLSIQRYKGLGEMNPDQLAETTMNPRTRTLLQVKIEDAVEADVVISTLMGDDVEPRREFIERNALDVQNLDV
jgi:DNA gyrase subunit B